MKFTDEAGQYILFGVIPETEKTTFNRAFGPFKNRANAYTARDSIIREHVKHLQENWYTEEEIDRKIASIKWTTTKLWSKTE